MSDGDIDLVNHGSSNHLLPDGTKPLPEPMFIRIVSIHLRAISQEMLKIFILGVWIHVLLIQDYNYISEPALL